MLKLPDSFDTAIVHLTTLDEPNFKTSTGSKIEMRALFGVTILMGINSLPQVELFF